MSGVEQIDVAVIGGGVTGLASARAIAARGFTTCVLERHPRPGLDTSTHNSGVIHAGIYYPAGTLKAKLCVEDAGSYAFCAAHNVPHVHCGKVIVAADDLEMPQLQALLEQGGGTVSKAWTGRSGFVVRREPAVHCVAALHSPDSGIVNAEDLVKALLKAGQAEGVIFLPGTRLVGADTTADGIVLRTERETILARQVVNAAGLYADEISAMLGGERFDLSGRGESRSSPRKRSMVNWLVYPLPHGHGLGVHS